jgi:hypothetical protein
MTESPEGRDANDGPPLAPESEQLRISPLLLALGLLALGIGLLAGLMMSSVALR